jgi:hypothetical protein|nr:MAG TPA_asm: hypothetical protein [Bacteriophage sp.]
MVKCTKFELIERILTGLMFDGSYWLIDNVLCKWDDEDKRFLPIMHPNTITGFEFNGLNDVVYELADYEVESNE